MDFLLRSLLVGAVLPGVLATGVFVFGNRRPGTAAWMGALGVAGAYLAGHFLIAGWPRLPPAKPMNQVEVTDWIPVLAVVAAIEGIRAARSRSRMPYSALAPVLLTGATFWLMLGPLYRLHWNSQQAFLISAGLAVLCLGLWSALATTTTRGAGMAESLALSVTAACSAAVLAMSGTSKVGQLAGVLAAALAGAAAAGWRRPDFRLGPSALPVLGVLFPALWLDGLFYARVPWLAGLMLALSAAGAALLCFPRLHRNEPVLKATVFSVAVVIPALLAVGIAWSAYKTAADASGYGQYYR